MDANGLIAAGTLYAALVSTVVAVWTIYRDFGKDRPRLRITGVIERGHPFKDLHLKIWVSNIGHQPVLVTRMGWAMLLVRKPPLSPEEITGLWPVLRQSLFVRYRPVEKQISTDSLPNTLAPSQEIEVPVYIDDTRMLNYIWIQDRDGRKYKLKRAHLNSLS